MGWTRCAGAIAGLVALHAGQAHAGSLSPQVKDAFARLDPDDELPVLVRFGPPAEPRAAVRAEGRHVVARLQAHGEAARGRFVDALARRRLLERAHGVRWLWIANAVALSARPDVIREIAALPGSFEIEVDGAIVESTACTPASLGDGTPGWNLDAVGAPDLWALELVGRRVVVAIVDTGVDVTHPDLQASYRGGPGAWFDPNGEHGDPFDASGHGTQVAGILVGASAIGVAPEASWIAAKIFDDAGVARTSAVHAAFQWALDPDGDPGTDDAPHVVNASFSHGQPGVCVTEFQTDLAALRAAGIVPVFAAGGHGPGDDTSVSPANDPQALAVGAIEPSGAPYPWSSRGPSACDGGVYPTFVAPGTQIVTTDLYGSYATVSGTSASAPHVAGVLALLIDAFPGARPERLEEALRLAAVDGGAPGPDDDHGHGRVDAALAYERLVADDDGDGWPFALDCDDLDPSANPAASEIDRDGIDQDCNGRDLTIQVHIALYDAHRRILFVEASSALDGEADLRLDGVAPMIWDSVRRRWSVSITIPSDPGVVFVSGPEGSTQATTLNGR
jgi:bacillopeptidase F